MNKSLKEEKAKWVAVARTPYEKKVAEIVFEKMFLGPKREPESRSYRRNSEREEFPAHKPKQEPPDGIIFIKIDDPLGGPPPEFMEAVAKSIREQIENGPNFHLDAREVKSDEDNKEEEAPEPKFVRPSPLPLLYAGGIFIFLVLAFYYYSGTP